MTSLDIYPDFAVRQAEGWDLFECCDSNHPPYELEMDDEAAKWDDDADVWRYVVEQAAHGRQPHVNALAFLALNSIEELIGIFTFLYYGEYRIPIRRR